VILADTSIWVNHLRHGDHVLVRLLEDAQILGHPWVLGEISLGRLANRRQALGLIANLAQAVVASHDETMMLIERHELWGRGIGLVDAQLLSATLLTADAQLWTRDKRLAAAAEQLGCAAEARGTAN
jgi:predicted nucleic acid-binding protein